MHRKKNYNCLFNHELLSLFTSQSPYQTYRENVRDNQVTGYVKELEGTQVDVLMCCPLAWRTILWESQIDRRWQEEAPFEHEPLPEDDWKYNQKAYYRARRYMLQKKDPVGLTLQAAREIGIDFFISYRMNDNHYLYDKQLPTHGSFWRNHPQYWIEPEGSGTPFNYMINEVRDYYFGLLRELAENYDIDGLELDFQRHPRFFPDNRVAEGIPVMNEFIRQVRLMLNEIGDNRGKYLQLCVRVPERLSAGLKAGLDVEAWDREQLVDMINISSSFKTTLEIGIEEFKSRIEHARIYGELHFVVHTGESRSVLGYVNNISRKTTREIYETAALNYWNRGVDGLSFFNFNYTRDHSFHEARRKEFPGKEPPFQLLRTICDREYLGRQQQHYYIGTGYGTFPANDEAAFTVRLETEGIFTQLKRAVLRVETFRETLRVPVEAEFDGIPLKEIVGSGELFPPFSIEGLPTPEKVRYFELPLHLAKAGAHGVRLFNVTYPDPYKRITFVSAEIALYTC
ncbi:hypothetical protein OB236_10660 [Paenibacillus sp. WQ 127069]|uniref:Glycosyl hydrolase-like 10 domain-containing protein n=1 Tax=Paenibacillus baimaensis TaxID=2982185 RepID=A0ABT2UD62_9BACL|nr:hypothetical protein [Paenibacillus sp. WQ 127069]MCU6792584.1 hypothetical protein [Paenibacillus sp. WQ 127069]